MGAWNYGTSDYVTVGIQPYDYEETKDYPEDYNIYEDDYNNAKTIMDKYSVENLEYFDVTLEDGYYEGFYLEIKFNDYKIENHIDRKEAQKEVTQLKKMLKELIDIGLCVVHPGWCTAYLNYKDSINEIDEAIKKIRNDVKTQLTIYQYNKKVAYQHLKKFREQVKEREEWLLYLREKADVWRLNEIKERLEKSNQELEKRKWKSFCTENLIEKNNEELEIINKRLKRLKGVA